MSATTIAPSSPDSPPAKRTPPANLARRRLVDWAATWLIYIAIAIASVPLLLLVYFVAVKGAGQLSWSFLSESLPVSARRSGGGIAPAIMGTLLTIRQAITSV